MKCYNNKIYSKDTTTNERLLLGDLILNNDNITITYGVSIKRIIFNSTKADELEDFNGNKYKGHKYILCAGANQTPAILQRSGIDCGNKLYDHAGFTIIYGKIESESVNTAIMEMKIMDILLKN